MAISFFTTKKSTNTNFFNANRQSPWYLVAIGMIGASLSGVTFISIPGQVGTDGVNQNFSWMQMVFGFLAGYLVIATILLPLYYRLNLTSIYTYLKIRFGKAGYKIGAGYFILSRVIGASFRLYLVAIVFQQFVFGPLGIPFWTTVGITIFLIWLYTSKGGIKTIVVTDTLQTVAMLSAVIITIWSIKEGLQTNLEGLVTKMNAGGYTKIFYFGEGWSDPNNFFKMFISGALITIVMTGLDQDMMQKNLTCRSLKDAQKNVFLFSIILVLANVIFLSLGALLYIYSLELNIPISDRTDLLYPTLAFNHLPEYAGVVFILGLIAAAYSSADSALTSLTTSYCIDFLDMEDADINAKENIQKRTMVHVGFSFILFMVIVVFSIYNNQAVIKSLFLAAGYTYGPLLGMYSFGLFTRRKVISWGLIFVCLLAPVVTYIVNVNSEEWFNGFQFGYMIIALNGFLTFLGLSIFSLISNNER